MKTRKKKKVSGDKKNDDSSFLEVASSLAETASSFVQLQVAILSEPQMDSYGPSSFVKTNNAKPKNGQSEAKYGWSSWQVWLPLLLGIIYPVTL